LGGALIQRHVPRGKLIAGASAATAVLSLGIYLDWPPDPARYLCCLALSFIGGLIPTAVLSSPLVLAKSPRQIGTLQGLFMQCANLAQFAGPPLIAALVAGSGRWSDALFVTGAAAIAGILLGLAILRIESLGSQNG
ncbi:MAG: MFS transporter, partial [Rhodocyclales bacterium]|nr:MFS transporter [Rhodocyclales bacterium]